jgi:hypothetical protein
VTLLRRSLVSMRLAETMESLVKRLAKYPSDEAFVERVGAFVERRLAPLRFLVEPPEGRLRGLRQLGVRRVLRQRFEQPPRLGRPDVFQHLDGPQRALMLGRGAPINRAQQRFEPSG